MGRLLILLIVASCTLFFGCAHSNESLEVLVTNDDNSTNHVVIEDVHVSSHDTRLSVVLYGWRQTRQMNFGYEPYPDFTPFYVELELHGVSQDADSTPFEVKGLIFSESHGVRQIDRDLTASGRVQIATSDSFRLSFDCTIQVAGKPIARLSGSSRSVMVDYSEFAKYQRSLRERLMKRRSP
jgi:hypothetical protein